MMFVRVRYKDSVTKLSVSFICPEITSYRVSEALLSFNLLGILTYFSLKTQRQNHLHKYFREIFM